MRILDLQFKNMKYQSAFYQSKKCFAKNRNVFLPAFIHARISRTFRSDILCNELNPDSLGQTTSTRMSEKFQKTRNATFSVTEVRVKYALF